VVRGAKAAAILTVKRENDKGEQVRNTRAKFIRCLFGYSRTTGDELLPAPEPVEWNLDRALDNAADHPCALPEVPPRGGHQGVRLTGALHHPGRPSPDLDVASVTYRLAAGSPPRCSRRGVVSTRTARSAPIRPSVVTCRKGRSQSPVTPVISIRS
jgi:hypothetical protein